MRLLFLTETVPYPLDSGGRIKTFHTISALAAEHEVSCHAFVRDDAQWQAAQEPLAQICGADRGSAIADRGSRSVTLHLVRRAAWREAGFLARSLRTGVPYTICRHFDAGVMAQLDAACRETRFDAIYCDHLSMFEYARRLPLPIVHDAHNVEHRIVHRHLDGLPALDPRRPLLAREWRRLRAYEQARYPTARLIFAVSDEDAAGIRDLAGSDVPIVVVPIAVDAAGMPVVDRLTDTPQIVFVGALDWPPNADAVEWFLRHVFPLVRARRREATFVAVGRGERTLTRRWQGMPGVTFTGRVPDVAPRFAKSRVHVVPIRSGSGMRVKILDAFARGVPVVTTRVGVEGILAEDGTHALVADTPEALAHAVLRVLDDRGLAERLARAARHLVLDRYDVRHVGRLQLDALRTRL